MNHQTDLDQTLADWLDHGAEQAPERFVWAALDQVERTSQRGAWLASTEEFLMQFKRAMPVLGVAAAVALAVIAFQFIGAPSVGDAEPTPRMYTSDDLANIVVTQATAPKGATVIETRSGTSVLGEPMRPGGAVADSSGFENGLSTDATYAGVDGIYTTWAVVFETTADAERAFASIADEHDSATGWDVADSRTDPGVGDESAGWTGELYGLTGGAETIFWRENNLLLAAIGFADWEADHLQAVAEAMADRAD